MKGKWYYSIADYANLLMVILFHQTILLLGEYALKVSPSLLYAGILAAVIVFSHFTRIHITHFVPYALFRIAGNSQNIPHSFNFDIVRMKCDHQKFQRFPVFISPNRQ